MESRMNRACHCLLVIATASLATACWVSVEQSIVHPPDDTYTPARLTIGVQGKSEDLDGALVTPRFFVAVPVQAYLGRFFRDEEYSREKSAVAVISHRYWTERFESNPAVVGSVLELNGRRVTVIGVAPPNFLPERGGSVWVPKTAEAP
jgi:hypothetical protein